MIPEKKIRRMPTGKKDDKNKSESRKIDADPKAWFVTLLHNQKPDFVGFFRIFAEFVDKTG
jgi:hypothetical protein